MLVGIISDTHDQIDRAQRAVQLLRDQGAQVLFHCGDLVEEDMIATCAVMPSYFVFGNNDADSVPEIRKAIAAIDGAVCLEWGGTVELAGQRLAMAHGHLTTDIRRLLATEPEYLFSGHSHIAGDFQQGKTRRINPGALHRAKAYSVALLNLSNNELRFLPIRP